MTGIGHTTRHRVCAALMLIYALLMLFAFAVPAWGIQVYWAELLTLSLFGIVHGSARYGWRGMLIFLALMLIVVNITENISIATGIPFGDFQHTSKMGPKLFAVPVVVGFAYFSIGYVAWVLATLLLGEPDRDRGALARVATPLAAMFIATAWDACIDPIGSTVAGNWIWLDGGGYMGVPFSNFVGWLITTYIAFQLFALMPAARPSGVTPGQPPGWWWLPVIQLFIMALQYPLNWLIFPDAIVTDPSGTTWHTDDIYAATTVVSVITLMFVTVTAGLLVARRGTDPHHDGA